MEQQKSTKGAPRKASSVRRRMKYQAEFTRQRRKKIERIEKEIARLPDCPARHKLVELVTAIRNQPISNRRVRSGHSAHPKMA